MEVTLKDQNGKKWKMFQLIEAVEHNTAKLDETLTKVDVVKIKDTCILYTVYCNYYCNVMEINQFWTVQASLTIIVIIIVLNFF